MKQAILLCFLFCITVSCKGTSVQDTNNILDETLRLSYLQQGKSKGELKSLLLFDNDKSANDCNSYLKLIKDHNPVESIDNQLVKSEYLLCDSLSALSQFEIYPEAVQLEIIGEKLLHNLDLRSFPNSFRRLTSNTSFTLNDLYPDLSSADSNTAVFESSDWVLTLTVAAVVNANDNTYQDWILQVADESKTGNYRNYATFIIYDIKSGSTLKAVSYP